MAGRAIAGSTGPGCSVVGAGMGWRWSRWLGQGSDAFPGGYDGICPWQVAGELQASPPSAAYQLRFGVCGMRYRRVSARLWRGRRGGPAA